MIRRLTLHPAAALALCAFAIPLVATTADAAVTSGALFGPRIGISSSPDQFVVGGQIEFPEFAPHLTVDPNVELGFLDHQTVISLNADFFYHFPIEGSLWSPYAGMGLSLNVTQFDSDVFGPVDSQTDAGANLVLGAGVPTRSGNRFFGELRAGLGDIPSLKIMAGWNFAM
jgi:hypothetical protein